MSAAELRRCSVLPAAAAEPSGWLRHEIEIRRSRFLGYAARVETEAQAREMVETLRRRHHDARHVCSAFVLGPERRIARSSDDGEPAGTAGTPMLEAVLSRQTGPDARDLTDVCAVVVRWFGGVKLGAGGLVRAYSQAVSETLDGARLVRRAPLVDAVVEVPHADAGRWIHELDLAGFPCTDTEYGAERARVHLAVQDTADDRDHVRREVARVSGGAAAPRFLDTSWRDLP